MNLEDDEFGYHAVLSRVWEWLDWTDWLDWCIGCFLRNKYGTCVSHFKNFESQLRSSCFFLMKSLYNFDESPQKLSQVSSRSNRCYWPIIVQATDVGVGELKLSTWFFDVGDRFTWQNIFVTKTWTLEFRRC